MTAKRKEYYKKLGAEYFEAERELVSKGEYEAGPVKNKWLMPACILMCVATFWSVNRLTGFFTDDGMGNRNLIVLFAVFAAALIVGVSLYNLCIYLLLRTMFNIPTDKICMYRRFIRVECGCRQILKKQNYFIAEIVPFIVFVVLPIALEFVIGGGWYLCYGIVMCTCQMMNVYYLIQTGLAEDTQMIGIIPGSGELRAYRLKKDVKRRPN